MTVESLRGEVVHCTRLARLFGAAKTTVDTWVAAGCPVVKRPASKGDPAEFNTAAVADWLVERARHRAAALAAAAVSGADAVLNLDAQRARVAKVQADRLEAKLALVRAELLPATEVERTWEAVTVALRDSLLALPAATAEVLANAAAAEFSDEDTDADQGDPVAPDERGGDDGPGLLRPPPRLRISDWAKRYRVLSLRPKAASLRRPLPQTEDGRGRRGGRSGDGRNAGPTRFRYVG